MNFRFCFERTLQAAAALLKLRPDRRMGYLRLLKLLYIADREMLAEHAHVITGDQPVAMKKGPVLSRTYDLIQGDPDWARFVSKDHFDVVLVADPGESQLSRAILSKLKEVTERYQDMDDWDMVAETHTFEEWRKNFPEGSNSSHLIPWEDALAAQGKSNIIEEVTSDERANRLFDEIFGR